MERFARHTPAKTSTCKGLICFYSHGQAPQTFLWGLAVASMIVLCAALLQATGALPTSLADSCPSAFAGACNGCLAITCSTAGTVVAGGEWEGREESSNSAFFCASGRSANHANVPSQASKKPISIQVKIRNCTCAIVVDTSTGLSSFGLSSQEVAKNYRIIIDETSKQS